MHLDLTECSAGLRRIMSAMRCTKCGSTDIDFDAEAATCVTCGTVLEETNHIVSDLSFTENAKGSTSVYGQFVSSSERRSPFHAALRLGIRAKCGELCLRGSVGAHGTVPRPFVSCGGRPPFV